MFGVGKSTVCLILKTFITAAKENIVSKYIQWPSEARFKEISEEFEQRWQYPMAVGAIDGCHINIKVPDDQKPAYYNYKCSHSILLMAICDANYNFYYVITGIPGRANDAGAFKESDVFKHLEQSEAFPVSQRTFAPNNNIIPYHLLGDSAFALKPWLIKPYLSSLIDAQQAIFNKRHSRARRVIENAFGRLKGRFRRLLKDPLEYKLSDAGDLILVCCALHNMAEQMRDKFDVNWSISHQIRNNNSRLLEEQSPAQNTRDSLKLYFCNQNFEDLD